MTSTTEGDLATYRVLHQHLRETMRDHAAAHDGYMQKVHRLMTVQGILFAALSFGLSRMERPVQWYVPGCGIVAAALLAAGFAVAIYAVCFRNFSIVGVKSLQKVVESEWLEGLRESEVHRQICVNLSKAINENLEHDRWKKSWGWVLWATTFVGFLFAAAFIGLVITEAAFR